MRHLLICSLPYSIQLLALLLPVSVLSLDMHMKNPQSTIRIPERVWRPAAERHQARIIELLAPGLMPRQTVRKSEEKNNWLTALDPRNPVYNFLIEYYGLKGAKGPKQLARWSPSPSILLSDRSTIGSAGLFDEVSRMYRSINSNGDALKAQHSAVLLQGATEDDFAQTLHLRGASICSSGDGVIYSPSTFFGKGDPDHESEAARLVTPFLWYKSVLEQTLVAEPILHCHGLHEWAMQYQPPGAPPPPSAKYQAHLPLRVSRDVINAAVERRGVSCTHVDALRFFAPAAGPLNHHGASLERIDQLRLEQPACVHAHMDLLKIALRLRPFCDPELIQRVLYISLKSRRLDVAASPYDASSYGVDVVPIEDEQGRAEYRKQQRALMEEAGPVRRDLLRAYDLLLSLGFDEKIIVTGHGNPLPERFAKAEPGGAPWRRNLINLP